MRTLILLTITLAVTSLSAQSDRPRLDKQVVAFDYATTITDAMVSSLAPRNCSEMNPIYGRHPSPGRYFAQMTAETTAVTLLSYLLVKHGHPRLAKLYGILDGSSHAACVVQTFYNGC